MYEHYLVKERLRWKGRKETGKLQTIHYLSKLEQRHKRRRWREQQRKCREKKKAIAEDTRPPTPVRSVTRQIVQGRKNRHNTLARLRYQLNQARIDAHRNQQRARKFKKRWQRAIKKQPAETVAETPRTKTKRLLHNATSGAVRKTLIFHHARFDQIRQKYRETVEEKQKQAYSRLLCGSIIKKYKFQKLAETSLGLSAKWWKTSDDKSFRRKKYSSVVEQFRVSVVVFFERDDVSRLTSGKKSRQ